MATLLSPEQQQALDQHGGRPIQVVHPGTQQVFVLIAGDVYDRLRTLLDTEPFDIRETYQAQSAALAKVWDDPALDDYNEPRRLNAASPQNRG